MLHKENFRPGGELAFSQDKAAGKAQGKAEETLLKSVSSFKPCSLVPHYYFLNTPIFLQG